MKNKFLLFALAASLTALLVMPGAFAATTTGGGTATVSVSAGNLTIALNGNHLSQDFSVGEGFTNVTVSAATTATDTMVVQDFTGTNLSGHQVGIEFDNASWTYAGASGSQNNPGVNTLGHGTASVGTDFINFYVDGSGNSHTTTVLSGSGCNAETNATMASIRSVTTVEKEMLTSTEDCPTTWTYAFDDFQIMTPSNGLDTGTYTITGTVTLWDGTASL